MSQKIILLTFKGFCMNFSLELKKIILSHPVTSKQLHKIVQILMRHPVGVKGIVSNQITGETIANASIKVTGNAKIVYTTKRGEYWRLLKPGKIYEITVSAKGYITSQPTSVIFSQKLTPFEYNVTLWHESDEEKIEQDQKENKHAPIFEDCDVYSPEVQEVISY